MSERGDRKTAEHRAKVKSNEDEVIASALQSDPNSTDPTTQYVQEVANDILARRAADN